jgi:carbamate kinase
MSHRVQPSRIPLSRAVREGDRPPTVVVALGGNALAKAGQRGTYEEQAANAQLMAEAITAMVDRGSSVVIVHGNGPQVGALAIQQEEAAALVPAQPLFALGAMTEASVGSMIELAIHQVSAGAVGAATLVTHSVISPDDPAFDHPTKFIGPFFSADEVAPLEAARGWRMHEDSGRGYRRVVPSPRPIAIVESQAIRTLINDGLVVIAAGGGGVPVVLTEHGYQGVDAVIDKDYAAALLASSIGAETLILVTGVDQVSVDFGTPRQRELSTLTCAQAATYLTSGQFPEGSMGPKVRAAISFVRNGGGRAVITSTDLMTRAVTSSETGPQFGTAIVPDASGDQLLSTAAVG